MEEKKESNLLFLDFSNQDLPAFVEKKGVEYVLYGEKNDYPYYLIDLYTQSPYHKAIIDGKVSYISGNGWSVNTEGLNTEQKALALNMLKQPFGIQDLDLATLSWSKDAELFNGICVKVTWSNDRKTGTLSYIDMANMRTNPDRSKFYYTAHWYTVDGKGTRKTNQKPQDSPDWKVYDAYNPDKRVGEQIYYWREHHPNQKVYPLPVYAGAVTWINVDVSLSKYFYHTVENCFVPTHLINFNNGEPSPEKKKDIEEGVKSKWTKPDGQRIIVSFNQNKDTAATIETLTMSDADKQYEAVRKCSEQAMFTGHRVTSGMLFGVFREGSLGGRSELVFAEEHFQNSYVTPRQNILENIINKLANDFGITVKFYLNKVKRIGWVPSDQTIEKMLSTEVMEKLVYQTIGVKKPETLAVKMSSEITDEDLVKKFESIAIDGSNYEVISERCIDSFGTAQDIENSEVELMAQHFQFEIIDSSLQRTIVDLLSKDKTLQPEALAKAAKVSVAKINKAIAGLIEAKVLSKTNISTSGESLEGYNVNEKGLDALEEKPAKTAPLKVVYSYDLAPRFKGEKDIISTSREFCRQMIALSKSGKVWTSDAIMSLNPGEDINPWLQRGGWMTIKGTDTHVPSCRHMWKQILVKEKTNG